MAGRSKTGVVELQEHFGHFINNQIFFIRHLHNSKKKALLRFIGHDAKGRMEFDLFRIYPELEDVRFGQGSVDRALTARQFFKKFKEYEFLCIDYGEDKEWEEFLESAHHMYRYMKLLPGALR